MNPNKKQDMINAERLILIREALGFDRWEDFALKVGYTNKYSYKNLETGTSEIPQRLIQLLIETYNVNPEFINDGIEPILLTDINKQDMPANSTSLNEQTLFNLSVTVRSQQKMISDLKDDLTFLRERFADKIEEYNKHVQKTDKDQ